MKAIDGDACKHSTVPFKAIVTSGLARSFTMDTLWPKEPLTVCLPGTLRCEACKGQLKAWRFVFAARQACLSGAYASSKWAAVKSSWSLYLSASIQKLMKYSTWFLMQKERQVVLIIFWEDVSLMSEINVLVSMNIGHNVIDFWSIINLDYKAAFP